MKKNQFLSVEEVAKMLRVNKRTVYRLVEKGEIPAFKFGKLWRIDQAKLEDLFETNKKK